MPLLVCGRRLPLVSIDDLEVGSKTANGCAFRISAHTIGIKGGAARILFAEWKGSQRPQRDHTASICRLSAAAACREGGQSRTFRREPRLQVSAALAQ
jgi:hypothetical protein